MRRARWLVLTLLLLASIATPLFAQGAATGAAIEPTDPIRGVPSAVIEGPPVLPGTIATTSISIPVLSAARRPRATFRVLPYPGVRLFSDTVGVVDVMVPDPVIPVTYTIARTRDVGKITVARVAVDWSDGTHWEAELEATVSARRGLRVLLREDEHAPATPAFAVVRYLITNVGNGVDTVETHWEPGWNWRVDQTVSPIIVAPGQTYENTVTVAWPKGTPGGEMRVVQLTAKGRGTTTVASAPVRVPFAAMDALGLAQAASTLFVGSSTDDHATGGGPSLALSSASQISPDTRVSLTYRRQPTGVFSRVFAQEVPGQQLRFELRQPGFTGTFGTIYQPVTNLLGTVAQGDGVDVDWQPGPVHLTMVALRPSSFITGNQPDQVLHASAGVNTPAGSVGVTATSVQRRDSLTGELSSVREAGLRLVSPATGRQRFTAEAGLMQLATPTAAGTAGISYDLNYDGAAGTAALFAHVHGVPATLPTPEVLPSMSVAGATLPVAEWLSLTGSGSRSTVSPLGQGTTHSDALSAGVNIADRGLSAQLLANLRRADAPFGVGAASIGRSVSAALSLPVSVLSIDAFGDFGTRSAGDSMVSTQLVRGGVRWAGERGWLWSGVAYSRNEIPGSDMHVEMSGALTRGAAQWQFGASLNNVPTSYFATDLRTTAVPLNIGGYWTRLAYQATANTTIISGIEYQPATTASRWRISLGAQQGLNIPIPVRRSPVVSGEVFEDLNGNGVRDDGEPGVRGVVLRMGEDRRETSASGGFAFADWSLRGHALDVDASSLPNGYMLSPDVRIASHGHVAIPVVRAAMLTVVVHALKTDGTLSEEIVAPDGLIVTLTDKAGRARDNVPTNGIVRFDAVLPGEYQLRLDMPGTAGHAESTLRTLSITVKPGEKPRLDVGAPSGRREIRFGPAGVGSAPPLNH